MRWFRVRFWSNIWCGDNALKEFPDLYTSVVNKEALVESILAQPRCGLASHGGTIALLIGIWWYAKKYGPKQDFDFVWVLDHLVIPVSFAACFIRLGNLFNSEIYGGPTTLPWGFVFERNGETEIGRAHV